MSMRTQREGDEALHAPFCTLRGRLQLASHETPGPFALQPFCACLSCCRSRTSAEPRWLVDEAEGGRRGTLWRRRFTFAHPGEADAQNDGRRPAGKGVVAPTRPSRGERSNRVGRSSRAGDQPDRTAAGDRATALLLLPAPPSDDTARLPIDALFGIAIDAPRLVWHRVRPQTPRGLLLPDDRDGAVEAAVGTHPRAHQSRKATHSRCSDKGSLGGSRRVHVWESPWLRPLRRAHWRRSRRPAAPVQGRRRLDRHRRWPLRSPGGRCPPTRRRAALVGCSRAAPRRLLLPPSWRARGGRSESMARRPTR